MKKEQNNTIFLPCHASSVKYLSPAAEAKSLLERSAVLRWHPGSFIQSVIFLSSIWVYNLWQKSANYSWQKQQFFIKPTSVAWQINFRHQSALLSSQWSSFFTLKLACKVSNCFKLSHHRPISLSLDVMQLISVNLQLFHWHHF